MIVGLFCAQRILENLLFPFSGHKFSAGGPVIRVRNMLPGGCCPFRCLVGGGVDVFSLSWIASPPPGRPLVCPSSSLSSPTLSVGGCVECAYIEFRCEVYRKIWDVFEDGALLWGGKEARGLLLPSRE